MAKDELNRADIHADNIGVVGDHAHVDGGIHFHYHETTSTLPTHEGRHDFYRHIPMPDHYIPRPEALDALREALLSSNGAVALTSAVKVALHGMGGIGKSVLARALCDDPAVQAAFPDGILWTTLGRDANEPALRSKLREWVETLGGIISENAPTVDQLKNRLAQLLEARACLLIVDDAWQHTHAAAFQAGGARCRLLLTTRDAEVAREIGATIYPVETLPPDQAVALLQEWARGKLAATPPDILNQIAKRLGCLPLALKLAGAQLRDKDPARWLEIFDARKLKARRLETLHDSLEQTLAVSLDALSPADQRCYTALAIFKEDEPIPLCALTRLWGALEGLDADESTALLDDLAARALLQLSLRHIDEEIRERCAGEFHTNLHDLLRDFIIAKLNESGALAAHRALLDAYHATKTGEGWHTVPDDGYFYSHLAYHLDAADDKTNLYALFFNDAWLHVRVPADDYTYEGYLADLALAWQCAQALNTSSAVDCIRLALIQTSMNSLATNYEPELVVHAVKRGIWSSERGMSIAWRVSDSKKQARMAIALLSTNCLTEKQRQSMQWLGLTAARLIKNEKWQVDTLAKLVPYLEDGLIAEVLAVARTIEDEEMRAYLLAALATHLEGDLLNEGLMSVRLIESDKWRAHALAALAPQLTGDLLADGLATAHAIPWRRERLIALAALAPYLGDDLLAKELTAACTIVDEEERALILTVLAPYLKDDLLSKGLIVAREIRRQSKRIDALAALAPYITRDLLKEGLAAANTITDTQGRAHVLTALALYMDKGLLVETLMLVLSIRQEQSRAELLVALAPQLKGDLLRKALAAARAIDSGLGREEALFALALQFTGEVREQILWEALAMLRITRCYQGQTLAILAPQLTSTLLTEALAIVREIADEEERAYALIALAPHLTGDLLLESLTMACMIQHEKARASVLAALSPYLKGDLPKKALEAVNAIMWEEHKSRVLVALAPHLGEDLLAEGLATACEIVNDWYRAHTLTTIVPYLGDSLLQQSLTAEYAIKDAGWQTRVLASLVPLLEQEAQRQVLIAALEIVHTIEWEGTQAMVLATLSPHLTGDLLTTGLEIACEIGVESWRAHALAELAPYLEGDSLAKGLKAALAITDENDRAYALASLAPCLEGNLLVDGLAASYEITDDWSRAYVLAAFAPRLAEEVRQQVLVKGLTAARAITDEEKRSRALAALAPCLEGNLLAEGLGIAHKIVWEEHRIHAVTALAPQMEEKARHQVLLDEVETANAIADLGKRANALIILAMQVTGETQQQVLRESLIVARRIKDEEERAYTLIKLVSHLEDELREQVLVEILEATLAVRNERYQADILATLAPHLEADLMRENMNVAYQIEDVASRAYAIAALSPHLKDNLLQKSNQMLIRCLWDYRYHERRNLFELFVNNNAAFLRAFDLPSEAYAQIAHSIIDICTKWDWI